MSVRMVCNYKKCRKSLKTFAWITCCSHAFCEDHGRHEFSKDVPNDKIRCPACDRNLGENFDVVYSDLNPPEAFKSMVLAGLQPHVIMDINARAMSFWSYQIGDEAMYQADAANHEKETLKVTEEQHALSVRKYKAALETAMKKVRTLEADLMERKRQTREYFTANETNNRKLQQIQHQLQIERRKSVHSKEMEDDDKVKRNSLVDMLAKGYLSTHDLVSRPN